MLLHGFFPTEVRVAAEVRAAVAAGFDVDVIALRAEGDDPNGIAEGARYYRLPINHVHGAGFGGVVKEYVGFTLLAGWRAARMSLRRRYDIVQVHNPPDFLVLAALVPRFLGARIVFDVHDLASDMFHMRFERKPGSAIAERALRALERLAARMSRVVLTVHEPYRRELVARGVEPSKVVVIMNSLDDAALPPPAEPAARNGFVVAYHGTVTPHYGVPLIVEAAAQALPTIPDLTVRIYGSGDAVPSVLARAAELGIEDRVWVSPTFLSQREVLKAVQPASVGVIPNLPTKLNRFALSTKLLEYVALGVPVVCSDLPTLREHFSEDEVLFFEAGNPEALAHALETTAKDPAAARRRADAALRRYESYRWPISAKRYVDALNSCLER
jgi:glycosyltransferase involved in cell wall biosynthesis